jgi:hypothetical protein
MFQVMAVAALIVATVFYAMSRHASIPLSPADGNRS